MSTVIVRHKVHHLQKAQNPTTT